MIQTDLVTEEIVIVGSRYGDYTDVLKPYYEKGEPIEPEDIKTLLGSNVVYLQPVHNSDDPYAVGVFITTEKRLGFVWKDQSPSLREVMSANNKKYYKAHIKRINTQYGLMMAEVKLPNRLADNVSRGIDIDEDWAKNIPETMTSITQQSLSLGFALLCDELPVAEAWNDSLENRLANLKRNLPSDLSAQHIRESLELYDKMRQSDIKEVRESCDNMLDAYVSRGSEKKMKLWANKWLPGFFQDAVDYDLLGLFEAANYTLERVEELLERAPDNLFYLYKYNRERFAFHLYYSALPQNIYNRLLTLLAVREAMQNVKRLAHQVRCDRKHNNKKNNKMSDNNNLDGLRGLFEGGNFPNAQINILPGDGVQVSYEAFKNQKGEGNEEMPKKVATKEMMSRAAKTTQEAGYWKSQRSWSVVYVVYGIWGYQGSVSDFLDEVPGWPDDVDKSTTCNRDAVEKLKNKYNFTKHIEEWRDNGVPEQYCILGEQLESELVKMIAMQEDTLHNRFGSCV